MAYIVWCYEGLYAVCNSQGEAENVIDQATHRLETDLGMNPQLMRFEIVQKIMDENEIKYFQE